MTDDAQKPAGPTAKTNLNPSPIPTLTPGADFEMNTNSPDSSRVMLIAMIVILSVAVVGAVIAITPQVKKMGAQKEKIADLEAQLAASKNQAQKPSAAELQLSEVQKKMDALASQAQQVQASMANGEMQGKLDALSSKFDQVVSESRAAGLTGMMGRIQALQQSPEGAAILSSLVGMLSQTPEGSDVGQNFEALRRSDPGIAQIAEGVAPEDMKAAAMLIALSQMRQSLRRNNDSFDTDLALLKKSVPEDNPQLLAAIDRLAPQAKYGVLTPTGLSEQFRGLTGDIVSASLSGKDVSVQEKAKARLSTVFMVEKNGQQVSGTEAQIAVAAAQAKLDAGDVGGAVEILKTIQGPGAEKTKPFIDQAQATMMAGNLESLISQNIVGNIRSGVKVMMNGGMPNGIVNPYGANAIGDKIQSLVPGASNVMPQPQVVK